MFNTTINKDRSKINRVYPFLSNFPFNNDFEIGLMEFNQLQNMMEAFDVSDFPTPPTILNFFYTNGPIKAEVSIFESEMNWLDETSNKVSKLDIISKKIEKAMKSTNIIVKKDAVLESEQWLRELSDGNRMLSHEVYNEALKSMLADKSIGDVAAIIEAISKLVKGTGLIRLSIPNASLILTYLQFRLIYVKLILGIVIAARISV